MRNHKKREHFLLKLKILFRILGNMSIQLKVENSVIWSYMGMCKRLNKSDIISQLKSQIY